MSEEMNGLADKRDRMLDGLRQFIDLVAVHIKFSGYGDSGAIDETEFLRSGAVPNDPKQEFYEIEMCDDVRDTLLRDCEGFAWDLLSEKGFSGNDEGGQGVIYIDVKTGEVNVDFSWNVIDQEDDSFCLNGDGSIVPWDRSRREDADASN